MPTDSTTALEAARVRVSAARADLADAMAAASQAVLDAVDAGMDVKAATGAVGVSRQHYYRTIRHNNEDQR